MLVELRSGVLHEQRLFLGLIWVVSYLKGESRLDLPIRVFLELV